MHHPWRRLREQLPGWRVVFSPRPAGVLGNCDPASRTIYLQPGMLQAQRRTVLDHELEHAVNGDQGCQSKARERAIERVSLRRLIPFDALLDAWVWAYSVAEMADELFVDEETMRDRIDILTDNERAIVRQALAERDFHEEGLPDTDL